MAKYASQQSKLAEFYVACELVGWLLQEYRCITQQTLYCEPSHYSFHRDGIHRQYRQETAKEHTFQIAAKVVLAIYIEDLS